MQPPILRVGVTGHRWQEEPAGLRARLERVMALLGQGRAVRLVSALAEGADRLVAELALAQGAELVALLPFPRDSYESDFASRWSRQRFRELLDRATEVVEMSPAPAERSAGYAAAGRAVLDRSDVLVAVWDGRPARGVGGTAGVVSEARDRGIPVVWVRPESPFEVSTLRPPAGSGVNLEVLAELVGA